MIAPAARAPVQGGDAQVAMNAHLCLADLPRAPLQPKSIIDRVRATCRFRGQPPHFEVRFIEYPIYNLIVRRAAATAEVPNAPGAVVSG